MTNKRKPKIIYTNPTTIDQRSVKASEKIFNSHLPEKSKSKGKSKK